MSHHSRDHRSCEQRGCQCDDDCPVIVSCCPSQQGPPGPEGPRGPRGEPGPTGQDGKTGSTGQDGKTGSTGPAGGGGGRDRINTFWNTGFDTLAQLQNFEGYVGLGMIDPTPAPELEKTGYVSCVNGNVICFVVKISRPLISGESLNVDLRLEGGSILSGPLTFGLNLPQCQSAVFTAPITVCDILNVFFAYTGSTPGGFLYLTATAVIAVTN